MMNITNKTMRYIFSILATMVILLSSCERGPVEIPLIELGAKATDIVLEPEGGYYQLKIFANT